jgi:hypothetical protein
MIATIAMGMMLAAIAARIAPAAQPISFAQANVVIWLSAIDTRQLRTLAKSDHLMPLTLSSEAMLLKAAPGLTSSCKAIVNGWGALARGRAEVTVRELGRTPSVLWMAYRCASGDTRLSKYYTERMAALDPAAGVIRFFRLDYGDNDRAGSKSAPPVLYHVAFAEALKLRGGADAASFFVYADGDDPNGGIAEDRLLIIAGGRGSMRPALSLLTMRKRTISANGGAAHLVIYRTRLEYVHDADGRVAAIVAYRRAGSTGFEPARPIATRYVWNPRGGFEPHREPR